MSSGSQVSNPDGGVGELDLDVVLAPNRVRSSWGSLGPLV